MFQAEVAERLGSDRWILGLDGTPQVLTFTQTKGRDEGSAEMRGALHDNVKRLNPHISATTTFVDHLSHQLLTLFRPPIL